MAVNITELTTVAVPGFNYPGLTAGQPMLAAVVDNFDNFAKIEAALPASVASINQYMTSNDKIFAARHNVTTWTATSFGAGAVVQYLGKFWYASSAAVAGDVPGTASKWLATGAPYIS